MRRWPLLSLCMALSCASTADSVAPARGQGSEGDATAGDDARPAAGGTQDTGGTDTGPLDAGPADVGAADAHDGAADAGAEDAGATDTGPEDAGADDTGPEDAGADDTGPEDAGAEDAGADDTGPEDAGPEDAGPEDAGPDAPPPPAIGPLEPHPGELTLVMMRLENEARGVGVIVVGPDGTTALIDLGDLYHRRAVLATLAAVNAAIAEWPGIEAPPGPADVDYLILTHYHTDHVGGLMRLFGEDPPLSVRRLVVERGPYDIARGPVQTDFISQVFEALDAHVAPGQRVRLCTGPDPAPNSLVGDGAPWPASGCPGLMSGDLLDPVPDSEPAWLDFGGGARMTLIAADGWVVTEHGLVDAAAGGVEMTYDTYNSENARSLVGLIRYGDFTYTFGGDLSGGGQGTPDVEGFVAAQEVGVAAWGGPHTDVMHLHHHGGDTSNQPAILDVLLPFDGRDRNALAPVTPYYPDNPTAQVMARLVPRLGQGRIWAPAIAEDVVPVEGLVVTGRDVVVRTVDAGAGYLIGPDPRSGELLAFRAVP